MLYIHRWASLLGVLLILYVIFTGVFTGSLDLYAQVTHQPASNPSLQEFRQHLNGTNNYAVLSDPDFAAATLPDGLNINGALARIDQSARETAPGQPMRLIELRMIGDRVAGRVKMGGQYLLFDAANGDRMQDALLPPANPNAITPGLRSSVKAWHKFDFNSFTLQKLTILNFLAGLGLSTLTITGLIQYFRVLRSRFALGKKRIFWSSGGIWRSLHRGFAVVCGVVVLYLATTGMLLSISDLGAAWAEYKSPRLLRPVNPDVADYSSPLTDAEIPAMASAALADFGKAHPGVPMKVIQLRYFVGYAQGVIVTGEAAPRQHVYNIYTGQEMGETEPGYPVWNFPFGWQWHQTVKQLHRGDFFGLTGNWIEWLAGVSVLYFAVSGTWMYYQLWARRAKTGRRQLAWK